MHYLMLGDKFKRQPQLSKFLTLLGTGRPIEESFTEAFQTDYASFEKDLQTYIGRFAFPAVRIKLQDKIDFVREMQLSSITEAEAQYYLGDLLLHMRRFDVAETQLKKAIALDSKLAPAYASLGMLQLRQEHPEEALKALTQAVQADSKNYMAHYYYAYLLQNGKDGAGTDRSSRYKLIREHLKKTIELAPDYLNAYDLLGYVALMLNEELTETEDLLKKALNASPGRRQVRLRLAELMIANKEPLPARVILTPLLDVDDEQVRAHARTLTSNIQTNLENEQAMREYRERLREFEEARATAEIARQTDLDKTTREEPDGPPTITRKPAQGGGDSSVVETAKVQLKRPAGQEIEGVLVSVDCSRGLTLRLRVGNGNVEFHADDASRIEFLSYTTAVSDSFACGPAKSEPPVLVVYRRGGDPRYLGEPIRVEFIEKK
jgi:tetratricopeptide (TPR) repeat protein